MSGSCHQLRTDRPSYSWTRRSAARAPVATPLTHRSRPLPSRIIGPYWPGSAYGARKMSPGVWAPVLVVTATEGGRRSGRETKRWNSLAFGGGGGGGGVSSERLTGSTAAMGKTAGKGVEP